MSAPPTAPSAADRRLAALAATFAPDVASRILGRLAGCDLAAWGQALAARPRPERLAALADALAPCSEAASPAAARALLDAERPSVACALERLALGRARCARGVHPLLARAALERLAASR